MAPTGPERVPTLATTTGDLAPVAVGAGADGAGSGAEPPEAVAAREGDPAGAAFVPAAPTLGCAVLPGVVGVPVMAPEEVFSSSPGGTLPETIANL